MGKVFIEQKYNFVMVLLRIYFHSKNETLLRAILIGSIRLVGPKAPPTSIRMTLRPPKRLEFEPLVYGRNIRTMLLNAGQLNKLYDFFQVAKIKRWGRKGRKRLHLAAEILPNAKMGGKGVLITPFKLKDLIRQGRRPKTIRTGQTRIEVNQKENIVKAAFKGYRAKGLDPKKLVLVASPRVQAMIPEPSPRLPRVRVRLGRALVEPVKIVESIEYAGKRFFVVGRRGSSKNLLAMKKAERFFRIGGKAEKTIRSKGKIRRRRV